MRTLAPAAEQVSRILPMFPIPNALFDLTSNVLRNSLTEAFIWLTLSPEKYSSQFTDNEGSVGLSLNASGKKPITLSVSSLRSLGVT